MKNFCKKCDKVTAQSIYSKETTPATLSCNDCGELNPHKDLNAVCPVDPSELNECLSCQ